MIYTVLPTGSFHGWGVCGKYIVKELSNLTEVKLVTEEFAFENILDEFDFRLLKSKLISDQEYQTIKNSAFTCIAFPVLQCITNNLLMPMSPNLKGKVNIGYTFFEDNILSPVSVENGRRYFDTIVTGSSWCEEILKNYGLTNTTSIIQGIDPTIFNPFLSEKRYFKDYFVIFSGGKFELRKGQDIVIKAFKILQDKYKDVMLVNSWFNFWPASFLTMKASPHISFSTNANDYSTMINEILIENGIDLNRVITLPPYPNIMMPRIYKNSDIGFFPNRCEGGTNLVLMEYMACAKPVIASFSSGHKDILTDNNSIKLTNMKPITITSNNISSAVWEDPDLDEAIAKLEWAYHNRDSLNALSTKAGEDLSKTTWAKTAQSFYNILTH
jgi:glycosyltransferase involved in cell wall biosynthesis